MNMIEEKSIYYRFGEEILGPFLYGYSLWLIENINKEHIEKILFLSRDGYMMKKAYEQLNARCDDNSCAYFYCSRKSLRCALLFQWDTYEQSLRYINVQREISIIDIMEYYGLSDEEIKIEIDRLKISPTYTIPFDSLKNDKYFKMVYDHNKEKIIANSKQQDEYLYKYITQIGIEKNMAVVDIGWHGSIQFYLEEFIKIHDLNINLIGFYVGIYPFYSIKGKMHGYLFENGKDSYRKKIMCSHGIIEKLFQSMEGSTLKYYEKDGEIMAYNDVYEYENEKTIIRCISDWQEAALDYLDNPTKNNEDVDLRYYASSLIKFGKSPSCCDTKVFSFMYNYEGGRNYYIAQKNIFGYSIKELKHCFLKSPWKTGFMKSLFRIPFPYYLFYYFFS